MGGILSDLGGVLGYAFSGAERGRASRDLGDAKAQYQGLTPTIDAQQADQNAYDQISLDPSTRDAQMQALRQLQGISSAGGMDDQSKAALMQAQMSSNQQAGSRNDAALEQAAQAGRLNSGRALSAVGANNQAAQNANAMAGAQAASDARSRALAAIQHTGQLGGQINQQDYSQAAQRAQAEMQRQEFNANQRQTAQQQTFNNSYSKAGGVAGADDALAGQNNQQAQQIQGLGSKIGDMGDQVGQAVLTGGASAALGGGGGGGAGGLMSMFG